MTTEVPAKKNAAVAILLDESRSGVVTVNPRDNDKFCMAVEDVVRACLHHQFGLNFYNQLKELRVRLGDWVVQHKDRLQSAYIAFRPTGELLFVAVQKGVERDAELSEKIADLDIEIATDEQFSDLRLEVLSLPNSSRESLNAFLSSGKVLVHADNRDASQGRC